MKKSKIVVLFLMVLFICGCGGNLSPSVDKKMVKITKQNSKIAKLKLNTNGHTSLINDLIVTKNKQIITASDDKTIRVWNQNGVEVRKILGEIGKGKRGMIYAIALTPDEKYLAVAVEMRVAKEKKSEAMKNEKLYSFDDNLYVSDISKYIKIIMPKLTKQKWGYEQKAKTFTHGEDFVIGSKK